MASETLKDSSRARKVGIILEPHEDLEQRVKKERRYFIRRYEIASDAAGDWAINNVNGPAKDSVMRFLKLTSKDLQNFDPSTIKRKRWLQVFGIKVPLPSVKS